MTRCRPILLGLTILALFSGCSSDNKPQTAAEYDRRQSARHAPGPESPPAVATTPPAAPPAVAASPQPLRGTVRETMDSGGYTYMRVDTDHGQAWVAATQMKVAVGDTVTLAGAMPMKDFHSNTLDRTFDEILFAASAVVGDGASAPPAPAPAAGLPPGHPAIGNAGGSSGTPSPASVKAGDIARLAGGQTVAELFVRKADLVGKRVRLRGRVVKANRGIMGKNWMHIQDGTGDSGSNDLTVTSVDGYAAPGVTVVVEGTLGVDKNIGAGYVFPVIIEDAVIKPEPADAAGP
ncbi:MAG: nucleotide-binding protein [Phycisphaerae bacterium]